MGRGTRLLYPKAILQGLTMNQHAISESSCYVRNLKHAWSGYRQKNPKTSTSDAAKALNVSEAELVALGCGANVTRLTATWLHLFHILEELGPVRVLTCNDHCVHEKIGLYRIIRFIGHKGLVQGDNIDLRLDLSHWYSSFAVEESNLEDRTRYSLQFFDSDGASVHKIYLTKDSKLDAYRSLIGAFKSPDQSHYQCVQAGPQPTERSNEKIDSHRLRKRLRTLKDPHNLHEVLNEYGVSQIQALRLIGSKFAIQISPDLFGGFLETVAAIELSVLVSAKSKGVIQIHSGPIENPRYMGCWLNILGDNFSLHVKEEAIASLWVVNLPVENGTLTSMELFDAQGENIAVISGLSKLGYGEDPLWHNLIASLPGVEELV